MDPLDILRRSLKITRMHRALWIFGILLALTGGGGDNLRWILGGGGGDEGGANRWRFEEWDFDTVSRTIIAADIVAFLLTAICVVFILIIICIIVRYVAATSLYRSVDDWETQGVVPMVRRGFSLGWSGRAFRQFAIDLVTRIPLLVAYLIMFLVALSPMLLLATDTTSLQVGGVFLTIGLVLLGFLVMIVVAAAVSLLTQFWHREAAIAGKGVVQAIRDGTRLARVNLRDAVMMHLVMIGVGFVWGLLMVPVFIVLGILALAMGGGSGFLIYEITSNVPASWLVGGPVGLIVVLIPLIFLGGMYVTFSSTTWTLTYLELAGRREPAETSEPEIDQPPSEEVASPE